MAEQCYVCTLCMRKCPVDALQCGQGRRALEQGTWGIVATAAKAKEWAPREDLGTLLERCYRSMPQRSGPGRGQLRVLELLSERGDMTQKALQEALGVQPGSVSEILSKLEGKDLIARERDEEDRRVVTVRLTQEGRAQLSPDDSKGDEAKYFAALTQQEQETLKELLLKLKGGGREEP